MKKIVTYILKKLSQLILYKYNPEIIAITGSVGKTSTRNAIVHLLKPDFKIRTGEKNYNTEIGMPLAIIGAENPEKSFLGWLVVFFQALGLIVKKQSSYPDILVLEMAADHPGDIEYLAKIARPKVAVITSVAETHLEFFGNVDNVLAEKSSLIKYLKPGGVAVLNFDDFRLKALSKKINNKLFSFAVNEPASIKASNIKLDKEKGGLNFQLEYNSSYVPVRLDNILGVPGVYAALAAASIAVFYGINIHQIRERLKDIQPIAGRLQLLPGIKDTVIIDDSYNSSPLAVKVALDVLSHLSCAGHKFAVLGDMLELGDHTKPAHERVGEYTAKLGIDYLITVGQASHYTATAASEYGMNPDRIFSFDHSAEAGRFLQDKIASGDMILVKGSESVRTEKIVKEVMAEPVRAKELLVRQYGHWLDS